MVTGNNFHGRGPMINPLEVSFQECLLKEWFGWCTLLNIVGRQIVSVEPPLALSMRGGRKARRVDLREKGQES